MDAELLWDNLAKSVYSAGTTDLYGGSTATSTATLVAGNVLTTAMVDEMVTRARENDIQPFGDGLDAAEAAGLHGGRRPGVVKERGHSVLRQGDQRVR